jgi:hypothetical protein
VFLAAPMAPPIAAPLPPRESPDDGARSGAYPALTATLRIPELVNTCVARAQDGERLRADRQQIEAEIHAWRSGWYDWRFDHGDDARRWSPAGTTTRPETMMSSVVIVSKRSSTCSASVRSRLVSRTVVCAPRGMDMCAACGAGVVIATWAARRPLLSSHALTLECQGALPFGDLGPTCASRSARIRSAACASSASGGLAPPRSAARRRASASPHALRFTAARAAFGRLCGVDLAHPRVLVRLLLR